MKIADLEHLDNVTKPHQSIQGGSMNLEDLIYRLQSSAWSNARATKLALTWTTSYSVVIAV